MKTLGFGSPKTIGAAAAGVAIVTGAVWGLASWSTGGQEKSIVPNELSATVLAEQAKTDPRKLGETMRETFRRDDLTDEQRAEVRRNMRQAWTGVIDERVDEYFAAAPEDRDVLLDTQIDEWQERMKGWAERRKEREREREARDRQNGELGEQEKADQERRRRWRGSQTRAQRKSRSESRDPDKSARRSAYFSAVQKRAKARGIEMSGPGGRGPRGRRG